MQIKNVQDLPFAPNVCNQILLEVEKQKEWSMAHVTMNPLASSLRHVHSRMSEIYIVTRGSGQLVVNEGIRYAMTAGCVEMLLSGTPHYLENLGCGTLEHLVLAFPPFDPTDVQLAPNEKLRLSPFPIIPPLNPEDCFDGAKIIPYSFHDQDMSIAFGWVNNDPDRRKKPHYHKKTREWVYVVEGRGVIQSHKEPYEIIPGYWISMEPGTPHTFVNFSPQDLVLACISSPAFDMNDVYY